MLNLNELIHDKINEIFAEYQTAHGITDGDIGLYNTLRLEKIEGCLENFITSIYAERINKPNFYIYTDYEREEHIVHLQVSMDKFFTEVSKRICFDDINEEHVLHICWQGKPVIYVGWQPGMKYEYHDLKGNTIWCGYFEEWDH